MDTDHAHLIANWFANVASLGAIVLTLSGLIPVLAAVIAATWYAIQIYESDTVKRWRHHRRHRRIARLQARLLLLQANIERQSRPE